MYNTSKLAHSLSRIFVLRVGFASRKDGALMGLDLEDGNGNDVQLDLDDIHDRSDRPNFSA